MTPLENVAQRAQGDWRSFLRRRPTKPVSNEGLRTLFYGSTCLLAATLPLDSLLGGYDPETGAGLRSPSWYVGLLAVALSLPLIPELTRIATSCRPLMLFFGAFTSGLVALGVAALGARANVHTDYTFDRPYKAMLMAALFMVVAAERPWRKRLVASFMVGWVTFIARGLYMEALGQAEVVRHIGGVTRRAVLGMNANSVSVVAGVGIVLLLDRAVAARNITQRLLALALTMAGVFVFLFGNSRTALAGLLVGTAALAWLTVRPWDPSWNRRAGRVVVLSAVSIAVVAWLLNTSPLFSELWEDMAIRVHTAASGDDRGARDELALATIELAIENPFGVGSGQTAGYLKGDPHNGYLKIVAEGGVVAAVLLLGAALSLIPHIGRAARTREDDGPLAVFVMLAVEALAGQALVESPFWLFFALVVTAGGQHLVAKDVKPPAVALGAPAPAAAPTLAPCHAARGHGPAAHLIPQRKRRAPRVCLGSVPERRSTVRPAGKARRRRRRQ